MMEQPSLYRALLSRKVALGATLGSAVAFMFIGVALWGGFNWGMEETNRMEFCISCHEMKDNVYVEYKGTVHDANRSGVRAGCPDCHVPRPWIHKIKRKIQASNEVWHKLVGTVDTPEKFDEHRLTMAKRVWTAMKETDSRECRNCHNWDTMNPERQKPRARQQHMNAMEKGHTCIDCHKGIAHNAVHKLVEEEELAALSAPNPAFAREVPESYLTALARVEAAEAEVLAQEQAQTRKDRDARKAAKQAEQERIEQAVAAALAASEAARAAAAGAPQAAAPTDAPSAAVPATQAEGFGVDWGAVPERLVTLFYPGQTSMEWTLVGKYHGGALPFKDGDKCTTCHEKELAMMGQKMVSGQKAETTPIPGKRAAIPVTVQAAHDDENIYLRFQWEDSEHAPVPFADGGKLDPENQVKLAVMLAGDDVTYAGQAGCWGTCHQDLRTMPGHPDDPAAAGLALDVSGGVTKYIKESRTKVEEKGRRGKKLGGWDKLKDTAALEAEMAAGHFMDLWRWKSNGEVENGHILEQRIMTSGEGLEARGWNDGGLWTVVMKRKLTSGQPGDIDIEAGKTYNFGFAIHDDFADARFHHVSLGYKLAVNGAEVDIDVVKAPVQAPAAAVAPMDSATGGGTAEPETAVAPAAPAAASAPAGNAVDAGVDWSKAGERQITLFYPGQTSMEWTLVGKYHGGALPFKDGDRCTTCHEKELALMGQKMVSGQKAETTPIPGKRAAIPVFIHATHDSEYMYLRFEWEDSEHAPVPFVDGGKMDPANQVKLAMMLATDEVEYASQAGCWGTCHQDLRTMPGHPDDPASAGLALDVSDGVTKYIKESRTKVEEKGRRGKKLGGWDKLKDAGAIEAELAGGHFMELLRVNSGDGSVEDGYVLDQRVMSGGQGFESDIRQEAGIWTVVLKRKLASEQPGDLTLAPGAVYNFGFAIHDDFADARYHHVSLGYKLALDNAEAELNVTAQ